MIGNMIEYVHAYGYFDFEALPFGAVDALVLAQFVYLNLENVLPVMEQGKEPDDTAVTLRQLQKYEKIDTIFSDPRYEANNRALFLEMCESKRFGTMKCMYCANRYCTEDETQFMALTCVLSDGSVKIVYRGTDGTIIGWKEDFNMAFQYPIPGQQASLEYLQKAAEKVTGTIDLIGHSKGGNLAVYAAMTSPISIQDRIGQIYNLDGPGFRTEVYQMGGFERISSKIQKIIPYSSIVGMLLENHGSYRVVASKNISFLQHDPYSWQIDRIDFQYMEQMNEKQRIMDENLNEWAMSLPKEEVENFVNALYQIVAASEATDLVSFTKNWSKSLSGMAGAIQNLDEETKNCIHRTMKGIIKTSRSRIWAETEQYLHSKIEGLTNR